MTMLKTFLCLLLPLSLFSQDISRFNQKVNLVYEDIVKDGQVDYRQAESFKGELKEIIEMLTTYELNTLDAESKKSLLINAYNIIVIKQIVDYLPTASVKRIKGFFQNKYDFAGSSLSLNEIEKLLQGMGNPDIHLLLVCGARSCPPIPDQAIPVEGQAKFIDTQIKRAIRSPHILQVDSEQNAISISNIFRWYAADFDDVSKWINTYIKEDVSDYTISYLDYDWALNQYQAANTTVPSNDLDSDLFRYFSSRLYERGQYEVNLFNNYYTQHDPGPFQGLRSIFFTSTIQYLHGINGRLNIGLDLRIRAVSSGRDDFISPTDALSYSNEGVIDPSNPSDGYRRSGLTAIAPRVKYQPFRSIPNMTFQHSLLIPTVAQAEGGESIGGFIDWGAPSLLSDMFYDQEIGSKGSIFLQVGLHLENTNQAFFRYGDGYYQISTPITFIYNYFASKKSTFYFLTNAAPRWGYSVSGDQTATIPDSYSQYGAGYKYFITDRIQAEVLYTKFFTAIPNRSAATYNLGVRYYGW